MLQSTQVSDLITQWLSSPGWTGFTWLIWWYTWWYISIRAKLPSTFCHFALKLPSQSKCASIYWWIYISIEWGSGRTTDLWFFFNHRLHVIPKLTPFNCKRTADCLIAALLLFWFTKAALKTTATACSCRRGSWICYFEPSTGFLSVKLLCVSCLPLPVWLC